MQMKVLKLFTESARSGCAEVDIFDLMYEICLPYQEIKSILDGLIARNEVKDIDVKTYKFIGNIDRDFGEFDVEPTDTICVEDAPEEDENIDEEEVLRQRHEYLERRRRELIAKIESTVKEEEEANDEDSGADKGEGDLVEDFADDDGEVIKSDDRGENADDVLKDTAYQLDNILDEESLRKRLLSFMSEGDEISRLAQKALKLCAADGYITDWLMQRELRMNAIESEYVRDILYRNNFIKCDICDSDKYVLAVPEELVYACIQTIKNRKNAFCGLINVLKNIGEQKRSKKSQTKTSACKNINNYQLKKIARKKLLDLLRADLALTRSKAIIKVEGCLFAARDIGDEHAKCVFEKVLEELTDMSNYLFNRLKNDVQD